ncbi:DUF3302 domain-containing protein [Falsiruegeria mediterranea]|uniref:Inner membrane protein YiaW n=1 Tax=Falsiruegeria mediterranea M17 TaxID=1200281 RepID=A0A2R8C940_9RHOB|nr:DUF3302 domain-containing protein [Falsiruegeria mediterranea]SPJ28932.1 Inner membrane protein YiaW [Falsiruegeria mediterranea M17]
MTGLDYAALGMLAFMGALAIGVIVFIGGWPGRVAAKRNHPYRSAVTVGGWITLIAGGVFFPLVLIWAYAGTPDAEINTSEGSA